MISSEIIISLLECVKKNDQNGIDLIIKKMIKESEKRGYHQIAKRLRELYSEPYSTQISKNYSYLNSSSFKSVDNGSNLYEFRKSKVKLKDIILSQKDRQTAVEIIETYKNKNKLVDLGLQYENKAFIYGPPGTGKTLFAYSLAGELDLPVLHVYLDSLISSYLGETGKNIGKIFADAEKHECLIFLDEFDAVGKMRDDNQDLGELKRVVVVLLQKIDEMSPNSILVAATNHDHLIDKAIRRRFNYEIHLDLLDTDGRKKLLELYLKKYGKLDYKFLAEITKGLSGSSIRQILNKSIKNWYLGGSKENLLPVLIDQFSKYFFSETDLDTKNENQMRILSEVISKLRSYNSKKYTYKYLEILTKIPDSTIYSIMEKYGN